MIRLFLLFIAITVSGFAEFYFVAPYGNDSNRGTEDNPFRTFKRAMELVEVGDTVYFREGVYPIAEKISISGIAGKPITFRAFNGEKVIFQGSYGMNKQYDVRKKFVNDSMVVTGSWLVFKDLEFRNGATSIYVTSNASFNRFDNISIHDNYYAGFILSNGASNNLIINCDSYNNFDSNSFGQHADGFVVVGKKGHPKPYAGERNMFVNCRAWGNSDDGFDCWMAGNTVIFIHCLAFKNGYDIWHKGKFRGDGNGFKLGVNNRYGHSNDGHIVFGCKAWDNKSKGFDYNDNEVPILLFRNVAWRNGRMDYKFDRTNHNLIQNIAIDSNSNYVTNEVAQDDNSWNMEWYDVKQDIVSFDDSFVTSARESNGSIVDNGFLSLKKDSHFFRESTNQKHQNLIDFYHKLVLETSSKLN